MDDELEYDDSLEVEYDDSLELELLFSYDEDEVSVEFCSSVGIVGAPLQSVRYG